MSDFLDALVREIVFSSPRIVQAGLGFLAGTLMAISGWFLGGDNRWVVAGVFGSGAAVCLAIFAWLLLRRRWD